MIRTRRDAATRRFVQPNIFSRISHALAAAWLIFVKGSNPFVRDLETDLYSCANVLSFHFNIFIPPFYPVAYLVTRYGRLRGSINGSIYLERNPSTARKRGNSLKHETHFIRRANLDTARHGSVTSHCYTLRINNFHAQSGFPVARGNGWWSVTLAR